jgi:hypothetical protein
MIESFFEKIGEIQADLNKNPEKLELIKSLNGQRVTLDQILKITKEKLMKDKEAKRETENE